MEINRISKIEKPCVIYLAGGCFWGTEAFMKKLTGVLDTKSGYANGNKERPSYDEVCTGTTGFAETVRILYNPKIIALKTLLKGYFQTIDPTSMNRQGNDRGSQYRSGIYYVREDDMAVIKEAVADEQKKYSKPVVTEVLPLLNFYEAEEYHQDYLYKHPGGYCHVNLAQADQFLQEEHLVIDKEELRKRLTKLQFDVTQNKGTEPPFDNEYAGLFQKGIYIDIVTGEPLFSSSDKFESGCGWPSFAKPISETFIRRYNDASHGMLRTEVRSSSGDTHLGHVFSDAPAALGGLRYCINSASLIFIPYEEMDELGYGYLKDIFGK